MQQWFRSNAPESISSKINVIMCLFEHDDEQVSHAVVPALHMYVGMFKSSMSAAAASSGSSSSERARSNLHSADHTGASNRIATGRLPGLIELTGAHMDLVRRLMFSIFAKMKSAAKDVEDHDDSASTEVIFFV